MVARTDPSTADHMTWDVTDLGFRMGLSPRVPDVLAPARRRRASRSCSAGHGLRIEDVAGWAVHPGGPRILDVVRDELGLAEEQLGGVAAGAAPSTATARRRRCCWCSRSSADVDGPVGRDGLRPGPDAVRGAAAPAVTFVA